MRARSVCFTAAVALAVTAVTVGCPSTSSQDAGDVCVCLDAAPAVCPTFDGGMDAGTDAGIDAGGSRWPSIPANLARVMSPITLVTIVASNDDTISYIESFGDTLTRSQWLQTVGAEYGVGQVAESVHYVGPAITAPMAYGDIVAYIQAAISGQHVPAPNGNTLYLLYLPKMTGNAFIDTTFCGYHNAFPRYDTTAGDAFAAVQHCVPLGNESALDRLTDVASHEIIEAATDPTIRSYNLGYTPEVPWTTSVWHSYAASGVVEVGDLCEGTFYRDNANFGYQRIWSNGAAAAGGDPCLPAMAATYFNVQADQDWYPGTAGSVVSIPLTGFANGPIGPWFINPHYLQVNGSFARVAYNNNLTFDVVSSLGPATCSHGGVSYTRPEMVAGSAGTLHVTVPMDAQRGDFAVFTIHSFQDDAQCVQSAGSDFYHQAVVGVYVP
jgi:hypothetical protein